MMPRFSYITSSRDWSVALVVLILVVTGGLEAEGEDEGVDLQT